MTAPGAAAEPQALALAEVEEQARQDAMAAVFGREAPQGQPTGSA
jgi:hypothetical protein